MTEPPRISVVIPCYNGARFLRETLASVARQTCLPHEVIVIDDGSTDDSASVAESFAPLVRVVRQTNQGESAARNRGLDLATGDWVALLDADDLWEPAKLELQLDCIVRGGSSYCCCYTDFYRFEDAKRLENVHPVESHSWPNARVGMLFQWCVHPSTALIRTAVARTVRFPENVHMGEDALFFARLAMQGRFIRVPQLLTGYRTSPDQQSKSRRRMLDGLVEKHNWFRECEGDYTPEEQDYVYGRLRDDFVTYHDIAYWKRNTGVVREFRKAYSRLFPLQKPPPSFQRRLYPIWMYRVRDYVDRFIGLFRSIQS